MSHYHVTYDLTYYQYFRRELLSAALSRRGFRTRFRGWNPAVFFANYPTKLKRPTIDCDNNDRYYVSIKYAQIALHAFAAVGFLTFL